MPTESQEHRDLNTPGACASAACAAHCAVTPWLAMVIPLTTVEVFEHPLVEWGLLVVAFVYASVCLGSAWRTTGLPLLAVLLFVAGFVAAICARTVAEEFGASWSVALSLASGALLIAAHIDLYLLHARRTPVVELEGYP